MGIPKFFRWISERYPLCSQLVVPNEIPEFDNFYLDMNGIIHNCSRPAGASSEQLEEHQMFIRIFGYIDDLFHKILPKKVFFLAVDGVAPRAKMNQQRSRRFRSAKEKQLDPKWNDSQFDSNCITPGTVFMHRLDEHLKYFLQKKVSEDPQWQNVTIIYSGHDVPGEGEHKIMEYIRLSKAQPDYNPNVRHCLYGLDADLIMLGLVIHDPHFCLLREEVVFGKRQVKAATNFYLLHLCLLREYIDLEFSSYFQPGADSFEYSLERILDDFILFSVLVGNDFLPSLSFIHIHEGAYELLFENYIKCLTSTRQYLNQFGKVNFDTFQKLIGLLAETEVELTTNAAKFLTPSERNALDQIKNFIQTDSKTPMAFDHDLKLIRKVCHKGHILFQYKEHDLWLQPVATEHRQRALEVVQRYLDSKVSSKELVDEWKAEYYLDKIGDNSQETVFAMCQSYLEGIQWVMLYYFEGVPSWSWYYPFHYAPKIVDIVEYLERVKAPAIKFQLNEPFKPFEQLMAVLPAFSSALVPATLASLMHDPSSPILHFYPYDFKTDLNGKQQEWEAVVLIPFINEQLLLHQIHAREPFLDEQERLRNRFGTSWIFQHADEPVSDWQQTLRLNASYFPPIKSLKCSCLVYNLPVLTLNQAFVKGLCEGVRLGIHAVPGFPTLHNLPLGSGICNLKVKVFSTPSKFPSLLLTVLTDSSTLSDDALLALVGKTAYYRWPYLVLCQIESLSDGIFVWDKSGKHESTTGATWDSTVEGLENDFYSRKAVNIGCTNYMASIKVFQGIHELPDGSKVRTFSPQTVQFPFQLIVSELSEEDQRFLEEGPKALADILTVGSSCLYVGPFKDYFGGLMSVVALRENSIDGMIQLVPNQFSFGHEIGKFLADSEGQYYVLSVAASKIGCSAVFLTLMSSPFYIEMDNNQRINISFSFKNEPKKLRVPGYSKKINNIWAFSERVISIMRAFIAAFPELFQSMEKKLSKRQQISAMSDVLPTLSDASKQKTELQKVKRWINEHVPESLELLPLNGEKLSVDVIEKCLKLVDDFVTKHPAKKAFVSKVPREYLIRPEQSNAQFSNKPLKLGDRISVFKPVGSIPIGMAGTIVGILSDNKYQVLTDFTCHGLFEKNESCFPDRLFTLPATCFINTTHIQVTHDVAAHPVETMDKAEKLKTLLKSSSPKPLSATTPSTSAPKTETLKSKFEKALRIQKGKKAADINKPIPLPESTDNLFKHSNDQQNSSASPSTSMTPSVAQFFNTVKQMEQSNEPAFFTPDQLS